MKNINTTKNLNLNEMSKKDLIKMLELELQKNQQLREEYDNLLEQIASRNKKIFGTSSETAINIGLFNDAEWIHDVAEPSEEVPLPELVEVHNKSKRKKARKPSDVHELEVVEVVHDLDDIDKEGYVRCGEKVREEICFQPARYYIKKHIYPVYKADLEDGTTDFRSAIGSAPLIEKSYVSSELAASVINDKYNRGLPLYRIEEHLLANDMAITRQTLSNWCMKLDEMYFSLLVNRMKSFLLAGDIIQCDETEVQVLHHQDGSTNKKSYMWVYVSNMYAKPIRLYVYEPNRKGSNAADYLTGFNGYISTDGYAGYDKVEGVIRVGCLAHARRGFTEAYSIYDKRRNTSSSKTMLEEVLKKFSKIFSYEKIASKMDLVLKQEYRLSTIKPLFEELKEYLLSIESNILPSSQFGKAITYFLNQYEYLANVFLDPRLELTNNSSERAVKPFVIGRKNWLFSNTTSGALVSANLFSIVQTAKENGLNVEKYLTYVLEEMRGKHISDATQFDYLLPFNDSLPEYLHLKKQKG